MFIWFYRQDISTSSTLEVSLVEKEKVISELHVELNNLEMQLSAERDQHLVELKRLNTLVNEKVQSFTCQTQN